MPNSHTTQKDDDAGATAPGTSGTNDDAPGYPIQYVTQESLRSLLQETQERTAQAMETMFQTLRPEPRTTRSSKTTRPKTPDIRQFFYLPTPTDDDPTAASSRQRPPSRQRRTSPTTIPSRQPQPQQQQPSTQVPTGQAATGPTPDFIPRRRAEDSSSTSSSDSEDTDIGPPILSSCKKYTEFHAFVTDSIRTSAFAASRDIHELAALKPYGEVWNKMRPTSRRQVWTRLQLFDLVARYGWAQALKLHPGTISQYSLPIEPAALALTAASSRSRQGNWNSNQQGNRGNPSFQQQQSNFGNKQRQWRPQQPQQPPQPGPGQQK